PARILDRAKAPVTSPTAATASALVGSLRAVTELCTNVAILCSGERGGRFGADKPLKFNFYQANKQAISTGDTTKALPTSELRGPRTSGEGPNNKAAKLHNGPLVDS
ncbi:hypothetical protein THAOC_30538, partial [Thalassiosira oceanica]